MWFVAICSDAEERHCPSIGVETTVSINQLITC